MNLKKVLLPLATIMTLTLLLVACSSGSATNLPVENTAAPLITPETTQEDTTQDTTETSVPKNGVPEDVPIMPDAYELQVATQRNVTYKVDAKIADVVSFYQEEFPKFGWDVTNNPDSVVGSMAQISRSNANGDRLVFSIQYNPVAEFSVVQIYITRK